MQTNHKIKDLFEPGALTSATKMVLVNAVYFKGRWKAEFDPSLTEKADFKTGGRVRLMRKEDRFRVRFLLSRKVKKNDVRNIF